MTRPDGPAPEAVRAAVGAVRDPELGEVTLDDLGLVRAVVQRDGTVAVELVPTFLGCPARGVIEADVRRAVLPWPAEITWCHEVWNEERVTPAGRAKLAGLGTVVGDGPCPRCAGRLEVLLRQVCEASAEWLSMGELPADVQPKVNREFANDVTPENGARALQALSQYLSPKQVTIEAVRHRILRPDFPVEDNLKELQDWAKQNAGLDAAIAEAAGGEPDPANGVDGEAEGEGEAA